MGTGTPAITACTVATPSPPEQIPPLHCALVPCGVMVSELLSVDARNLTADEIVVGASAESRTLNDMFVSNAGVFGVTLKLPAISSFGATGSSEGSLVASVYGGLPPVTVNVSAVSP